MTALAMTPDPAPQTLEPLAAALLIADPAARLLARTPGGIRLKLGESSIASALLLSPTSREAMLADVQTARGALEKGKVLRILVVDTAGLGAGEQLKAEVKALKGKMAPAHYWVPGQAVETLHGAKWPLLDQAIKALEAGQVGAV